MPSGTLLVSVTSNLDFLCNRSLVAFPSFRLTSSALLQTHSASETDHQPILDVIAQASDAKAEEEGEGGGEEGRGGEGETDGNGQRAVCAERCD